MAKKITKEIFKERFQKLFPEAKIQIIEYSTISQPCIIKCLKCGTIKKYAKASNVLRSTFCCETIERMKLAIKEIKKFSDFCFVKRDKQNIILKHNKCQNEFKRNISTVIKNANHCPYCDENKGSALDIKEAQAQLDKEFFGGIKLLEYNAIRTRNTYKCLKCGLIFKQTQKNLLASRGCPKCDRIKSKGERKIEQLLRENKIIFKSQVAFSDLSQGRQHFDFIVYDNETYKNILYCIECQGEQHRVSKKDIFRDSLDIIQERDERKRKYCREKNIPLYEIIYQDGRLTNLEILPFINKNLSSTTIYVK